MKMYRIFYYLIFIGLILNTLGICKESDNDILKCTICLRTLTGEYSIDAWKNPFHTHHVKEGIFCHSCSRIISQGITHGGFRYSDGRHLCSLCQISVVEEDSIIHTAYTSVLSQFNVVGIQHIPSDIPIELINLIELNEKCDQAHGNLKGFTHTNPSDETQSSHTIFILSGLPRIEFEAVLAHELLHVWLQEKQIKLSPASTEGFCNLGRYLIYQNDNTHFSSIHLKAMDNSKDSIYGIEYRKMKAKLEQKGWKKFITFIMN